MYIYIHVNKYSYIFIYIVYLLTLQMLVWDVIPGHPKTVQKSSTSDAFEYCAHKDCRSEEACTAFNDSLQSERIGSKALNNQTAAEEDPIVDLHSIALDYHFSVLSAPDHRMYKLRLLLGI